MKQVAQGVLNNGESVVKPRRLASDTRVAEWRPQIIAALKLVHRADAPATVLHHLVLAIYVVAFSRIAPRDVERLERLTDCVVRDLRAGRLNLRQAARRMCAILIAARGTSALSSRSI
ncbi:hypothetical protein ABI_17070 [Asticcacaulis biprosthecium C19]|uniref:Uncharacterized protein n=1 Tax=Asticcacaulis biprosthecium C19 TaxID=715226 RepID=F4QK89_9CAUL|nr:hypothetical protein ABI_17070 [Asticcacaulis biprosthecium C19]